VRQSIWVVPVAALLVGACNDAPTAEDKSFQDQLARASASNKAPVKKNMLKKMAPPDPNAPRKPAASPDKGAS